MLVMITVENTRLLLRFKHTHRRRKLFPNWEARSHLHSSWWLLKEFPLHRSIKTQQNSSSIHLKTVVCSRNVWMEHFKPKFCQTHRSDLSQLNLTQAFTLKPNKRTSGEGLLQTWRRKGLQHALIEIENQVINISHEAAVGGCTLFVSGRRILLTLSAFNHIIYIQIMLQNVWNGAISCHGYFFFLFFPPSEIQQGKTLRYKRATKKTIWPEALGKNWWINLSYV